MRTLVKIKSCYKRVLRTTTKFLRFHGKKQANKLKLKCIYIDVTKTRLTSSTIKTRYSYT